MSESASKQRAEQVISRLYSPRTPAVERVRYPDGSEQDVPVLQRTLKKEESNAYFQKLAEEEERAKAEEEARAARDLAQKELGAYKADMEAKWRQAGGTLSNFDEAWPEIKRRYLLSKIGFEGA